MDYPTKAAKLREIEDLPTERAVLGSLANVVYDRPAQREVELWRVRKAHRELRCLAVYLARDLRVAIRFGFSAPAFSGTLVAVLGIAMAGATATF